MAEQNQTLGRGEVHFSRFKPGTYTPEGFRYLGNTPEFNLTVSSETLAHYSSDRGTRIKDRSVNIQTDFTGTFTCDDISLENLALFFLGNAAKITQASAQAQSESFVGIKLGHSYQIGETDLTPVGVRNVTINTITSGEGAFVPAAAATGIVTFSGGVPTADDTITVGDREYTFVASSPEGDEVLIGGTAADTATNFIAVINGEQVGTAAHATVEASSGGSGVVDLEAKTAGAAGNAIILTEDADNVEVSGTGTLAGGVDQSGAVPLVANTDYELDSVRGVITFLETSPNLTDNADVAISSYDIAAATYDRMISGSNKVEGAIRFDAYNAEGDQIDYRMAFVTLSPNGDLPLKGEDWMAIPFNVEINKLAAREAIYANGQPFTV